jgi:CDP-paratose 2-epimerase
MGLAFQIGCRELAVFHTAPPGRFIPRLYRSKRVPPHYTRHVRVQRATRAELQQQPCRLRDRLGLCQWFHYEDRELLDRSVDLLHELGIRHLRTGISWADFFRPGGKAWYDRQMSVLHDAGFEILLSVWHTPPSIAEAPRCNAPPRRTRDYADFIDRIITEYGHTFSTLELWNEPNNRYKWDFEKHDPDWSKFARMIVDAAHWARKRGVRTCLGGMIPVDHHWLDLMESKHALSDISIIAIHAFPGMWWPGEISWDWQSHWRGWEAKLESIRPSAGGRPIWVTETGLATCDHESGAPCRHDRQVEVLEAAARAPAERLYWYSLIDLDPAREAIEGFHVDENEYHMGLVTFAGERKPAFHRLRDLLSESAGAPRHRRGGAI